jgi:Putative cyclase
MLDTGSTPSAAPRASHSIGGADDVIFMPLQASTQWDGLGYIFDHGMAWNGRRAGDVVTSEGDLVTGIETVAGLIAGRGVLLDVGRMFGDGEGELPDGFAITVDHLEATIAAHGRSAQVRPRVPAAAPGRHPAHRSVPRGDVGRRRPRRGLCG